MLLPVSSLALFALCGIGDESFFTIRNGYFEASGSGTALTRLRVDPSGRGQYGRNWTIELGFEGLRTTGASRVIVTGQRVHVTDVVACKQETVSTHRPEVPFELLPGRTLGQSFTVPPAAQCGKLEIQIPTWHTSTSGAAVRLRKSGPDGQVLRDWRLENVRDNAWVALEFPAVGEGQYYVEMAEPAGRIGWWGSRRRAYSGGQAFLDGKPVDAELAMKVHIEAQVARGSLVYELREKRLSASARLQLLQGAAMPRINLVWLVRWDNSGYDVSSRAVPFWRFFTDQFRYMPAQQLKRWREREGWYELSLDGRRWIECDGTENADFRLWATAPVLRWHLQGERTAMYLSVPRKRDGSCEVEVEVKPRDDVLPGEWPRFRLPGRRESDEATVFFCERALSYPAVWGPAAWHEWNALGRLWHFGPHVDAIRAALEAYPISAEGYVHTWGANPGWPFPDNEKYDTRHFDTNARFILACWRYAAWTRDVDFIRRQAERIRKAMNYQLTVLKGETGLIYTASKDVTGRHMGVGNNYWDILPFGHLDAYANIVFYASLEAMAQIEEMLAEVGGQKTDAPQRSPQFYRDLARKAKRVFNEAFWDDEKGRYIGCIDVDGRKHDYGFTFVNLEAMAYGLADEEQARRIYRWMEREPTSSGKPDTYSCWIFAPRATTVHNPMWDPQQGKMEDVPQEPWWHFGWRGTKFGDQCQDGGAILYTSFFDLMARTRFLGPDNALARWREIMARWRMPDHLCGGPPLCRGELPQQINPGQVGVDVPFPESSLVACWLVYGVAGISASSRGLEIAPRLPRDWPALAVENVGYRGLPLVVEVTRREVTVRCEAPGHQFVWRRPLGAEGKVIFKDPPAPVQWPEQPLFWAQEGSGAWRAQWIWEAEPEAPRAFFRRVIELPTAPQRAWLAITADNSFELYVNGRLVGTGNDWARLYSFDIRPYLKAGRNVLAVAAENAGGPGGLVGQGEIALPEAKLELVTDGKWRWSSEAAAGWRDVHFDDTAWAPASLLGQPPCGPWGDIGEPAPPEGHW
ncbi:MAG: hypothetical protein H5T86_01770 [Armatimonadetes bacterium]|nr:hypothetical protein [Armatimonadota bacterium]